MSTKRQKLTTPPPLQGRLRVQGVQTWEGFTLNPNGEVQIGPCWISRVLGSGDPLPLSPTAKYPILS